MTRALALIAGLVAAAEQVLAQAPHDSVIADLHLGGDSVQAAVVALRTHEAYLVEVAPARAQIRLHLRASAPQPFLAPIALADRAPPDGGAVFGLAPRRSGEYVVELTNPDIGATHVRVIWETILRELTAPVPPTGVASEVVVDERPTTVFDETFPGPPASVLLAGDVVYRVEISPATTSARVAIHSARSRSGPPLVMYPTDERAIGAAGATFVIIPTNTDEYRLDVAVSGDEPARVRIIRDPKESARWVRVAEETRDLPRAGLSARAVAIGAFPRPSLAYSDTTDLTASGLGMDLCFGTVARGGWTGGPIGGCAFSLAFYRRNHQADVVAISIAPRLVLTPPHMTTQFSLGLSVGIGTATRGSLNQSYGMVGLSGIVERAMSRHWVLEAEAGFTAVSTSKNVFTGSHPALAYSPRAAIGVQYRP
jgi:hypothetical protein